MDCADFKDLVALFALGALDASERIECEAHLALRIHHDHCAELYAEAMQTVAALGESLPAETPGTHVWAVIERGVRPSAQRVARARRRTAIASGVALACAAGLLFALWLRRGERAELAVAERTMASAMLDRDQCRARVEDLEGKERLRKEAVALLELPGTQLFPLQPQKGATAAANAIMHTGVKRAYVITDGLTPLADRDYQMWIAAGKHVVPAGVIRVDGHGRAVVKIEYAALLGPGTTPDAMMVTVEPRGGSAVVSGPTVLLGSPRS
jgi:anti-sigma-K factor RskA